mgnify:CR=1 FL=1
MSAAFAVSVSVSVSQGVCLLCIVVVLVLVLVLEVVIPFRGARGGHPIFLRSAKGGHSSDSSFFPFSPVARSKA